MNAWTEIQILSWFYPLFMINGKLLVKQPWHEIFLMIGNRFQYIFHENKQKEIWNKSSFLIFFLISNFANNVAFLTMLKQTFETWRPKVPWDKIRIWSNFMNYLVIRFSFFCLKSRIKRIFASVKTIIRALKFAPYLTV